ncbi:MAG: helix-turn-helix domain-containing protein [Prolixibacteraceae bacterium]
MRKFAVAAALSFDLLFSLSVTAYPANSSQNIQDTAVARLFHAYQYLAASDLIAAKLAKGDVKAGSDLQLYYFNTLSMAQIRLNHLDSAKNCAYRSMKIASKSKDSTLVSDAWKVMSYAYNRCGQLDSALYFTNKLLDYSKRAGDDKQYRNALSSMGTILNQNKRPGDALKYYKEANQVTTSIRDTASFALCQYNLGLTFQVLKQYDSCFYYLNKAVLLAEKGKQSDLLFYTYGALSECYIDLGQKEESKRFLLKANSIAIKIGNLQFLAMGYSNLARIALNEENFKVVIQYGLKADSLLKKNPYQVLQMNVDSMMYTACSKLSRSTEALEWYVDFVKIKEKVIGEKQTALLNKMMVEYGTREKNLTISKQNAEIRDRKIQLRLLSLLLLITVFSIALMFRYFIKIRRHRESLYHKEKYLDQQLTEMAQYKHFLLKSGMDDGTSDQSDVHVLLEETVLNPSFRLPLYQQLRELLETRKLYLDPELNQQTLITMLGTNKKYLYQALAGYGEENFRSLINRYRVDESKRLIEQSIGMDSTQDMTTVYQAAGFNSAASFYRIFKNLTGLTPAEYANEARKELKKSGKLPS